MKKKLVIIGNGIAGVSLALELQKLTKAYEVTIVSGESDLHYSRPALMYIFMGHMRLQDTQPYPKSFWKKQDISLVKAWVRSIDVPSKKLFLDDGRSLSYDTLVLATGSKPNKFGWPGQDLLGVQGFYSLQDLNTLESNVANAKSAVIVGGGLIGIELAEMLHQRGLHVTFLVRENSYWRSVLPEEESAMVNRVIKREGIDLRLSTNLREILDDGTGRVAGVVVEETGERIDCDLVGLTTGVSPNIRVAQEAGIETAKGIVCNPYFETKTPDIFAIGDCAEIVDEDGSKQLDQLWYTGKMQGTQLAKTLAHSERRPYTKPIFYNSAKFFDLEYQTYGVVPGDAKGYYWEARDGLHSLRLTTEDGAISGVNVMGMRLRHRTCEDWIKNKLPIEEVFKHLPEANFDPEFYKRQESEIVSAFRNQHTVN